MNILINNSFVTSIRNWLYFKSLIVQLQSNILYLRFGTMFAPGWYREMLLDDIYSLRLNLSSIKYYQHRKFT